MTEKEDRDGGYDQDQTQPGGLNLDPGESLSVGPDKEARDHRDQRPVRVVALVLHPNIDPARNHISVDKQHQCAGQQKHPITSEQIGGQFHGSFPDTSLAAVFSIIGHFLARELFVSA